MSYASAHQEAGRSHRRRLLPSWVALYSPFEDQVRRQVRVGTAATVASAAFESFGLASLGIAATKEYQRPAAAVAVAAAIAGTLILSALAKALSESRIATGQVDLETSLRRQITDAILLADWEDFVDQPGHELQSAALAEAPQVAQATFTLVRARGAIAAAVVVFVSTFFVSVIASVICAGFGALIVVVYNRASRPLTAVQEELVKGNTELTRHTSILISGLRSLRLSPVQSHWRHDLDDAFDRHARARARDMLIPVRGRLLIEVLAGLMIFAVLLAQVAISGDLLPGLIVMALILRIMPRAQGAQQMLNFARHATVWIDRWNARLGSLTWVDSHSGRGGRCQPSIDPPVLDLRNVSFSYRRHDRPVLTDINLQLRRGEWVSLRGVSGGGKSTLIDVIGGILVPTSGQVSLRGRPIRELDQEDRYSNLVVVPQDVHLLGTTTDEILTWGGRLGHLEDIPAIRRALGVDQMFLFGEQPPGGRVDELSRDISGGMRTRLAMARALVSQPAVLILDETTSRLHPQAEAEIFEAVRDLRPDLAVLVVTHRQETTALVDRQLDLVDGRLRTVP